MTVDAPLAAQVPGSAFLMLAGCSVSSLRSGTKFYKMNCELTLEAEINANPPTGLRTKGYN